MTPAFPFNNRIGTFAVDAILATAITVSLVEPVPNGIGSDTYIASGLCAKPPFIF